MKSRWILIGLAAAVVVLVVLTLRGLRASNEPVTTVPRNAPATTTSAPASKGAAAVTNVANETPPWQATPESTPTLPPGTVPAWKVSPPPPDPSLSPPSPPREPPNPALHRPSMDNPGGVNGDRPERTVE